MEAPKPPEAPKPKEAPPPPPAAPTPPAPPVAPTKPPEPRALFYVLSFIFSIVGLILGIIYLTKPEPENKRFGRNCLLLGIIPPIVFFILWFIIVFLIIGVGVITTPTLEELESALFLS